MSVSYSLYVKDGDRGWTDGQDGSLAGTVGRSLKTDAFRLASDEFTPDYRIHVESHGWLDYVPNSRETSGVGKRLEAIEFRNVGSVLSKRLIGRVHLQGIGWCQPVIVGDGTAFGTVGQSRRLEAAQFVIADVGDLEDSELNAALEQAFRDIVERGGHRNGQEGVVVSALSAAAATVGMIIALGIVAGLILASNRAAREEAQRSFESQQDRDQYINDVDNLGGGIGGTFEGRLGDPVSRLTPGF